MRSPFDEARPMTDGQRRIDLWIREQQNNTLKYRDIRKKWRAGAVNDVRS